MCTHHLTGTIVSLSGIRRSIQKSLPLFPAEQMIDTQAPLRLHSSMIYSDVCPVITDIIHLLARRQLILDLFSVHLIRRVDSSVIISFHPTLDRPTTTADYFLDRIRSTGKQTTLHHPRHLMSPGYLGQSVYWQKIFQVSPDPTFVLLIFIWHALYAWDEALQDLYTHICRVVCNLLRPSRLSSVN